MTSKEKLDKLLDMQCSLGLNPPSCLDQSPLYKKLYNSLVKEIEQLETTNRNNEKVVADGVKLLNRVLELQARLEALEKENIELRQEVSGLEDYSYDVDCEKELLKKEKERQMEEDLNEELKTLKSQMKALGFTKLSELFLYLESKTED